MDYEKEHGVDTRFAIYAFQVLNNFLDNYQIVKGVLENIGAKDKTYMTKDILKRIRTNFLTNMIFYVVTIKS